MLIVSQVAVSLVLLIGAGLLARTLENLQNFYPGFNKEGVLLLTVNPGVIGYNGDQGSQALRTLARPDQWSSGCPVGDVFVL
jgi:hypothetical protein